MHDSNCHDFRVRGGSGYREGDPGGAVDFLKKPFTEQGLLERVGSAITIDAQRRKHISESRAKLSVLTPREREVMDRLIVGKSTKEIVRELGISRTTADKHRAKVFEKLEADSIVDLVRRFPAGGSNFEGS
ncbi:MAG: LuxR C-terminal-related transcriptional regulator [Planctomycetota bacterium]